MVVALALSFSLQNALSRRGCSFHIKFAFVSFVSFFSIQTFLPLSFPSVLCNHLPSFTIHSLILANTQCSEDHSSVEDA